MIRLLTRLLGRLPIGWLQLAHKPGRLIAAISGVAFANVLVLVQLGLSGSLEETVLRPYRLFDRDLLLVSSIDSAGFDDGSNLPRARLHQALSHPQVADGAPLYVGRVEWLAEGGDTSALALYGMASHHRSFFRSDLEAKVEATSMLDTALTDRDTRFLDMTPFEGATPNSPVPFEIQGRRIRSVGTFSLGGGFGGDGGLLVSDQTFFRLSPKRSSAAPSHLLLRITPGADPRQVAPGVSALIGPNAKVSPIEDAMAVAAKVQLRDRPTGIIFGFGVLIGIIVGIVIAYQVLATDVADHLKEYATLKAMGYPHRFFVAVILEEALVLGALGFIPGIGVAQLFYDGLVRSAGVPLFMTMERAVGVFIGTLVACSLSGMLAIRRLRAADPADLF
ncbi:MAG: FtsX-like permease family protein [Deltaproteobacteria bacterium]|nr:FtsX-like permease family protein [Deltaproteobacteria bacterium]